MNIKDMKQLIAMHLKVILMANSTGLMDWFAMLVNQLKLNFVALQISGF